MKFAIFGNPVEHSISPIIQTAAFKACNFDATYTKIKLEDGKELKNEFFKNNLNGANVTVPFKENAFEQVDEVRGLAKEIKAVNTIVKEDEKLIGYNTDAIGFFEAIKEFDNKKKIKKTLILGAGGTAKAIALILNQNNIEVSILNRSKNRLDFFKEYGFASFTFEEFSIKEYDIIINSTSAGLNDNNYPAPKEILEELFKKTNFAVDCIYNKTTPFLALASKYNLPNKDGKDMLIFQGVFACEYFMNDFSKRDIILKAMKESIS